MTNTLLIRHGRGYIEVTNADSVARWGRIEGFLSLGALIDPAQVAAQGQAFLELSSQIALTLTAGIDPTSSADTPYEGFGMGDTLTVPDGAGGTTTERVVSLNVSEDEDFQPLFTTELGVAAVLHEERLHHWLTKLLNGTLAGTAWSASPVFGPPPAKPVSDDDIIDFHVAGPLVDWVVKADDTPFVRDGTLWRLSLTADTAPSTQDVIIHVLFNGSPLLEPVSGLPYVPTLHVGQKDRVSYFNVPVHATRDPNTDVTPDKLSIAPIQTDPDAAGLHAIFSIKHA